MHGSRQSFISWYKAEIEGAPRGVSHGCAIGPSHGGIAFRVSTRTRSDKCEGRGSVNHRTRLCVSDSGRKRAALEFCHSTPWTPHYFSAIISEHLFVVSIQRKRSSTTMRQTFRVSSGGVGRLPQEPVRKSRARKHPTRTCPWLIAVLRDCAIVKH
jgi:hypothetical protein